MVIRRRSVADYLLSLVASLLVVMLPLLTVLAQDEQPGRNAETDNPAPVFQHDDILPIRIEAPFSDIFRSRGYAAEYFPATLYYSGTDDVEVATALEIKT